MSARQDAPLLEVQDLTVRYRLRRGAAGALLRRPRKAVRAVDGVSLTVRRGELVALVGESGCGKTTTGLATMRMIEPVSGSVRLAGQELVGLSPRALKPLRRRMQMIYQDPYDALDPRFRVRDTVEEPLLVHGGAASRIEREQVICDALGRAGLSPPERHLDRHPHELSGGQRQRVAIAASLAVEPDLLIADEPVSMLDVSARAAVLALMDDLRGDGKMGILMITHDLSTAGHFADRIAVMYLGRIVEEGPAREVLRSPRHPYTKALLSVVPRLDPANRPERQVLRDEPPDPVSVPLGCRFHPRCPAAQERCMAVDPQLRAPKRAAAAGHRAACILV